MKINQTIDWGTQVRECRSWGGQYNYPGNYKLYLNSFKLRVFPPPQGFHRNSRKLNTKFVNFFPKFSQFFSFFDEYILPHFRENFRSIKNVFKNRNYEN